MHTCTCACMECMHIICNVCRCVFVILLMMVDVGRHHDMLFEVLSSCVCLVGVWGGELSLWVDILHMLKE